MFDPADTLIDDILKDFKVELCAVHSSNKDKNKSKLKAKIKHLNICNDAISRVFKNDYSIKKLNFFELVNDFQLSLFTKKFYPKEITRDDQSWYDSITCELIIYTERLLELGGLGIDYNLPYRVYSAETMIAEQTLVWNVNELDALNLVLIILDNSSNMPANFVNGNSPTYFYEVDEEYEKYLNSLTKHTFKKDFYSHWFNPEIDKIGLYSYILSNDRNRRTHYSVTQNEQLKSSFVNETMEEIQKAKIMNVRLSQKPQPNNKDKLEAILSLLYLYLVYIEIINLGPNNMHSIISNYKK